jgi:hypothetical protein
LNILWHFLFRAVGALLMENFPGLIAAVRSSKEGWSNPLGSSRKRVGCIKVFEDQTARENQGSDGRDVVNLPDRAQVFLN